MNSEPKYETKFRVGDHVVVTTARWGTEQQGLTGTVYRIKPPGEWGLPIEVEFDEHVEYYNKEESYEEYDLELTEIGRSPLWKALS